MGVGWVGCAVRCDAVVSKLWYSSIESRVGEDCERLEWAGGMGVRKRLELDKREVQHRVECQPSSPFWVNMTGATQILYATEHSSLYLQLPYVPKSPRQHLFQSHDAFFGLEVRRPAQEVRRLSELRDEVLVPRRGSVSRVNRDPNRMGRDVWAQICAAHAQRSCFAALASARRGMNGRNPLRLEHRVAMRTMHGWYGEDYRSRTWLMALCAWKAQAGVKDTDSDFQK